MKKYIYVLITTLSLFFNACNNPQATPDFIPISTIPNSHLGQFIRVDVELGGDQPIAHAYPINSLNSQVLEDAGTLKKSVVLDSSTPSVTNINHNGSRYISATFGFTNNTGRDLNNIYFIGYDAKNNPPSTPFSNVRNFDGKPINAPRAMRLAHAQVYDSSTRTVRPFNSDYVSNLAITNSNLSANNGHIMTEGFLGRNKNRTGISVANGAKGQVTFSVAIDSLGRDEQTPFSFSFVFYAATDRFVRAIKLSNVRFTDYTLDMTQYFTDANNLTFNISHNNNPNIVTPKLTGTTLALDVKRYSLGTGTITVTGTDAKGKPTVKYFYLTVAKPHNLPLGTTDVNRGVVNQVHSASNDIFVGNDDNLWLVAVRALSTGSTWSEARSFEPNGKLRWSQNLDDDLVNDHSNNGRLVDTFFNTETNRLAVLFNEENYVTPPRPSIWTTGLRIFDKQGKLQGSSNRPRKERLITSTSTTDIFYDPISIDELNDGSILISGNATTTTITQNRNSTTTHKPFWDRYDASGNFLVRRRSNDSIATSFFDASQGKYISSRRFKPFEHLVINDHLYVTGIIVDGVDTNFKNIFVGKFDLNGTKVWSRSKPIPSNKYMTVQQMATDTNGNLYVLGGIWNSTNQAHSAFIKKYASHGALLWEHVVEPNVAKETKNIDGFYDIAFDKSGNSYVVGSISFIDGKQSLLIEKRQANGTLIWQRNQILTTRNNSFANSSFGGYGNSIVSDRKGGFWILTGDNKLSAGRIDSEGNFY